MNEIEPMNAEETMLRGGRPAPAAISVWLLLWWLGLLVAVPSQASAQVKLMKSSPENGVVLTTPARSVRLWFDGAIDPTSASIEIDGPASVEVTGIHTMGDDDLMGQIVGAMPDGAYRLTWRLGSESGEKSTGSVQFEVRRAATATRGENWEPPLDIGIVLYDGAEPLDVFGPLEMWMNAGPDLIRVHLIAEHQGPVVLTTTGYPADLAPRVEARYSFENAPDLDVLMVPGGLGTLREVDNDRMIEWLSERSGQVVLTTSVCTGSALLAKAGVLDGEKATGNKVFFDYIRQQGPNTEWIPQARWVDSGRVMTSSGVSAGIDMSLAVIARFFGVEGARMVAAMTEYEWQEDSTRDPFTKNLNLAMPGIERLKTAAKPRP